MTREKMVGRFTISLIFLSQNEIAHDAWLSGAWLDLIALQSSSGSNCTYEGALCYELLSHARSHLHAGWTTGSTVYRYMQGASNGFPGGDSWDRKTHRTLPRTLSIYETFCDLALTHLTSAFSGWSALFMNNWKSRDNNHKEMDDMMKWISLNAWLFFLCSNWLATSNA